MKYSINILKEMIIIILMVVLSVVSTIFLFLIFPFKLFIRITYLVCDWGVRYINSIESTR